MSNFGTNVKWDYGKELDEEGKEVVYNEEKKRFPRLVGEEVVKLENLAVYVKEYTYNENEMSFRGRSRAVSFYCYPDLFIFGGGTNVTRGSKEFSVNLGSMIAINLMTLNMREIDQSGDIPSPRINSMGIYWKKHFYLFGGSFSDEDNKRDHNDFYRFNPKTNVWKKIKLTGRIPRRSRDCISFLYQDRYFCIIPTNYGVNTDREGWKKLYKIDLEDYSCKDTEINGSLSGKPMMGIAFLGISNGMALFHGGSPDWKCTIYSDLVFSIDIKSGKFKILNPYSQVPKLIGHYKFGFIMSQSVLFANPFKRENYCSSGVIFGGMVKKVGDKDLSGNSHFCLIEKSSDYIKGVVGFGKQVPTKVSARTFATVTEVTKNKFILFGGHTDNRRRTPDLVICDIIKK